MGATSWRYFTRYLPTPQDALQELREEVFARGAFVDPTGSFENTVRQKFERAGWSTSSQEFDDVIAQSGKIQRAVDGGETRGLGRADKALVQRLQSFARLAEFLGAIPPDRSLRPAGSIEELLERAAECGTHSILDIERVDQRPSFGTASPMTRALLRRVFGTSEPTHDIVEQRWSDVAERLSPWQARYVLVHDNGHPNEYAFIGCSGD